jgi:hypothetical protein
VSVWELVLHYECVVKQRYVLSDFATCLHPLYMYDIYSRWPGRSSARNDHSSSLWEYAQFSCPEKGTVKRFVLFLESLIELAMLPMYY